MKPTGVFYHISFSRRSYLTIGTRLKDFPEAFKVFESRKNFLLVECPEVSEELILKVHSKELLEGVKRDKFCSTAWRSAGGVVKAGEMIFQNIIRNAFCYIGAGGHHAGKDYFWGYCCFNDVVLSIRNIFDKFGRRRIAIIDTDAHHGDGTRELVKDCKEVLHFCICGSNYKSEDGLKIDVSYFGRDYHTAVEEFCIIAEKFKPDLVFWYFGHDTHIGDYGDIGLTIRDYIRIARRLKDLTSSLCDDRLIVVLGGGSDPDIARDSTIAIINILLD